MTKSSQSFFKLLLLVLVLSISLGANAQQGANETFGYHDDTGMVRFIGADSGVIAAPGVIAGQSFDKTAAFWLNNYSPSFGADASQMMMKSITSQGNRASVRYDQVLNGVPVFGAEIVVNVTANGDLIGMSGEVSPALTLSTTPQVSAVDAMNTAIAATAARMEVNANTLTAYATALTIFDGRLIGAAGNGAALAYAVEVSNGAAIDAMVFVDATSGAVPLLFNRIDTKWGEQGATYVGVPAGTNGPRDGHVVDVSTYTANNTETQPGTLLCSETSDVATPDSCTSGTDVDADNAHYHAAGFNNFLYDEHGRHGLDDNGFALISTVHYDVDYCNAFWNGSQMTYGDGCPLVVDDVIGHELTHGFTEFTSNLVYFDQSGAINESLSDIWGEVYDQIDGHEGPDDGNDYTWRLGEELSFGYTDSEGNPLVGLRDMKDPNIFGDPGAVNDGYYWFSSADIRGVHINSGISNKTAYLMADGGEYSGVSVKGIGASKMLAVFYEIQTNWLTYGSNFKDMATVLWQGCNALANDGVVTANDCNQVARATAATQLHQTPIMEAGPTADMCPVGHSVAQVWMTEDFNGLLFPDFSSEWLTYTIPLYAGDEPFVESFSMSVPDPSMNGNYFAHGPDNSLPAWAEAISLTGIVPDTYPTYLYFEHQYRFEFAGYFSDGTGAAYDTGHVAAYNLGPAALRDSASLSQQLTQARQAVSNGTRALPPGYVILEPDDGALYDALSLSTFYDWFGTLEPGFGNYSGPASSRVPLSDYAGDVLLLSFSTFSDIFYGENGMIIDNVAVYTCLPDLVQGGEFEDKTLIGWTVKPSSGGDKVKCNKADKGKIFSYSGDCAFQFRADSGQSSLKYKMTENTANEGDNVVLNAQVLSKGGDKAGRFLIKAIFNAGTPGKVVEKLTIPFASLDLNGYTSVNQMMTLETIGTPDKVVTKVIFNENVSSGKMFVDDLHVWLLKDEMAAGSTLAAQMLGTATLASNDAPRRVDDAARNALPLPEAPDGFRD